MTEITVCRKYFCRYLTYIIVLSSYSQLLLNVNSIYHPFIVNLLNFSKSGIAGPLYNFYTLTN